METERKLLKIPLGFRSKIPRRGIHEYQRPENFAKHNALCKRDENYGILMGKPNNAICLDYDIYDPNCKEKQKYTLEYFKKVCGDDVYISRTPSGGYHAVFQYEARFDTWKNATKINGFIDIRTTGGYICGNGCETGKGSYCRLNGNILKLTNMPDTLYDMVEENANFAVRERTETKAMYQNIQTQGIPGDINTGLQHLGFSGIYWTTRVQVRPKLRRVSFVWKNFTLLEQLSRHQTRTNRRLVRRQLQPRMSLDKIYPRHEK